MQATILRDGTNRWCKTQTGDHHYPATPEARSAARAHAWFSLNLCMAVAMVFIYFSHYIISPQKLLDGDNVHVHHAPFTGLQLRLLVTLRVTTTKSVTEAKLTNKSMSSGENNLSDNKRQLIFILLAEVSCCLMSFNSLGNRAKCPEPSSPM